MAIGQKKIWLFILLIVAVGCKIKETPIPTEFAPIANFGIIPPGKNLSSVTIIDSSKYAVLYELNYGDGYIRKDSLNSKGFGKTLGGHYYQQTDSSRTFTITFTVINKKGDKDSKVRKVVIPPLPEKIPTIDDSVRAGYYNTVGELSGLIDDQAVHFESNDTTIFSGSQLFSNNYGNYYHLMMFSKGISRCNIQESYAILLPITPNQPFLFERSPPQLRYQVIHDSLRVDKSFQFYYISRSGTNNTEEGYQSKIDAKLTDLKEINISPDLYYSVFEKGLEATFEIKSDKFETAYGKKLDKKIDVTIKMIILVDRRNLQLFSLSTLIGFCF